MNEEFYSIGRGSLNINGKFYYGLDYQITDFMRNLDQENQKLKQKLEQRDNIINKAREYIKENADIYTNIMGKEVGFFKRHDDGWTPIELLEILNIDKGDE